MPRPQFTLRTLLVGMLGVGAFLGGMALQAKLDEPLHISKVPRRELRQMSQQVMVLRDGGRWYRFVPAEEYDQKPAVSLIMPRRQFIWTAMLVSFLAVACFFGGIRFERERQRREDESQKRPKKP